VGHPALLQLRVLGFGERRETRATRVLTQVSVQKKDANLGHPAPGNKGGGAGPYLSSYWLGAPHIRGFRMCGREEPTRSNCRV